MELSSDFSVYLSTVSAVPSFQAGASAESQGDKGGRVRERTGQKAVKPKTLSSTLPSRGNGGFLMPFLTNAVVIAGNAIWPVSLCTSDFEEGN